MEESIRNIKAELAKSCDGFLLHTFRESHQTKVLKVKRENLDNDELFIWMDYSENYSCKYHREVQSHYYGASREQVTLHTGVAYQHGKKQAFCTVSKSHRHDPPAILAHLSPILQKFVTPDIKKIHFQSDSPSTQYRNKTWFYVLSHHLPAMYPRIEIIVHNYSEAGHGKAPPDGVGACVKTVADDAVKNGDDVASFDALVALLMKKCTNIIIETVSEESIEKVEKTFLRSLKLLKVPWMYIS